MVSLRRHILLHSMQQPLQLRAIRTHTALRGETPSFSAASSPLYTHTRPCKIDTPYIQVILPGEVGRRCVQYWVETDGWAHSLRRSD
jgi:hypothetical protein